MRFTTKHIQYSLLLALSMLLSACSGKEDDPTPNPNVPAEAPQWSVPEVEFTYDAPHWAAYLPTEEECPDWKVDLSATQDRPQWEAPDNYLYSLSMTAVLQMPQPLEAYQSDDDIIAAFIGDECRGIGDVTVVKEKRYYFVNIKGGDTEQGKVIFKYYCQQLRQIFSVDVDLKFQADMVYGTVSEPKVPAFHRSGKYPLQMTLEIEIRKDMGGFAPSAQDKIAAFVGNDCRGVASINPQEDKCQMLVLGSEEGEPLDLYYYTAPNKGVLIHKGVSCSFASEKSVSITPSFMPISSWDAYIQINKQLVKYDDDKSVLAIFVGDVCRGYSFHMGNGQFHTMLLAKADETAVIKYYNDQLSYVFESEPILVSDLLKSSPTNYVDAALNLQGQYPLVMAMLIALPDELAEDSSDNDVIGAFVGSECRGIAYGKELNEEGCYFLTVVNGLMDSNKVTLKYYNANQKRYYQAKPYIFEHDKYIGWFDYPEYPYFTPLEQ